jgi:hypothetical protein
LVSDIDGRKRLKMFENRSPRRIFVLKEDEMLVGLRKLHNEELHICTLFTYN